MFELDVSRDGGQTWTTEKSSQSLDTVKSAAKSLTRVSEARTDTTLLFRIYALGGEQLILVNRPTGSWRIKWVRANMRPRATQVPVTPLSPVR